MKSGGSAANASGRSSVTVAGDACQIPAKRLAVEGMAAIAVCSTRSPGRSNDGATVSIHGQPPPAGELLWLYEL